MMRQTSWYNRLNLICTFISPSFILFQKLTLKLQNTPQRRPLGANFDEFWGPGEDIFIFSGYTAEEKVV